MATTNLRFPTYRLYALLLAALMLLATLVFGRAPEIRAAELPTEVATVVQARAATAASVEPARISIIRAERVTWNNGCLGVEPPGSACTQALVPGWVAWAAVIGADTASRYHTNIDGSITLGAEANIPVANVAAAPLPAGASAITEITVPWDGPTPRPNEIALSVTAREVSTADLVAALTGAGCRAQLLATTANGDWAVYVVGGPAFVNAAFRTSFAANVPFFVKCAPAVSAPTNTLERAPIESIAVVRTDEAQPLYSVEVTSGLPGGCAKFERIDTVRTGNTFEVAMWNRMEVPPSGACTAIYGYVQTDVDLGRDLVAGAEYIVIVNGKSMAFIAGTGVATSAVLPPIAVHLTGQLPDTSVLVPPGQGEAGRVTVRWQGIGLVDSFRIYVRDCGTGVSAIPVQVGGGETAFGPLQPCRPGGNVGVSAVRGGVESAVTWAS